MYKVWERQQPNNCLTSKQLRSQQKSFLLHTNCNDTITFLQMVRISIIVMAALIAVASSAPQGSQAQTVKSPADMSYQELQYILQTKRGENTKQPKVLSPCARAILGCCTGLNMNSHCSEQLNCGAFFFDANPCEEQFVLDALNAAKRFYSQFDNNST